MAHLLIHRGLAKKNFTENTISAFRYCFKKNYGIETDIHCTKDNKVVCFHDFNLRSKFKINKSLKNIKYQELLKISKSKKKPIPLLKDLTKLSKNKKFLMLEIKPLFSKENLKVLLYEVKKLRSGCVYINGNAADSGTPFGGYRQSGNGREGGTWGLEEFLEIKTITGWK